MQEKNGVKEKKMLTLGKSRSVGPGSSHKLNIAPEIGGQLALFGGVPTGRGTVCFLAARVLAIADVGMGEAVETDK
jgi:hypothetical protein